MSALIGTSWPVNSVGVLPDVDPDRPGYLEPKLGQQTLAETALVNAKMILEQYRVKHGMYGFPLLLITSSHSSL
jgi:phosphatidylinositol glycan class N